MDEEVQRADPYELIHIIRFFPEMPDIHLTIIALVVIVHLRNWKETW